MCDREGQNPLAILLIVPGIFSVTAHEVCQPLAQEVQSALQTIALARHTAMGPVLLDERFFCFGGIF